MIQWTAGRYCMLAIQSTNCAETVTHWCTFSSHICYVTVTFSLILLWVIKLTFIWVASQTHRTVDCGQLRILGLFMGNHCTLSMSQFGVGYTQQLCLVPTSLRMKWTQQLRIQATITKQWPPHSLPLLWSTWWMKNGTFSSNKMVQAVTLQENQRLAHRQLFSEHYWNKRTLFAEKSLACSRKHWHQWWSGTSLCGCLWQSLIESDI